MPRVGHAVAVAGSSMFMYGGTVGEGRASDDLDDFRTVLWELKVRPHPSAASISPWSLEGS